MVPWWRASWSFGGPLLEQPCSGLKLWSSSSMWKGRNWYLTMTVRSWVSRNGRTHPLATVCSGGIWFAELCSRRRTSFLPNQCCSGARRSTHARALSRSNQDSGCRWGLLELVQGSSLTSELVCAVKHQPFPSPNNQLYSLKTSGQLLVSLVNTTTEIPASTRAWRFCWSNRCCSCFS